MSFLANTQEQELYKKFTSTYNLAKLLADEPSENFVKVRKLLMNVIRQLISYKNKPALYKFVEQLPEVSGIHTHHRLWKSNIERSISEAISQDQKIKQAVLHNQGITLCDGIQDFTPLIDALIEHKELCLKQNTDFSHKEILVQLIRGDELIKKYANKLDSAMAERIIKQHHPSEDVKMMLANIGKDVQPMVAYYPNVKLIVDNIVKYPYDHGYENLVKYIGAGFKLVAAQQVDNSFSYNIVQDISDVDTFIARCRALGCDLREKRYTLMIVASYHRSIKANEYIKLSNELGLGFGHEEIVGVVGGTISDDRSLAWKIGYCKAFGLHNILAILDPESK